MAKEKKVTKSKEIEDGKLKAHYYTRGGSSFTRVSGRKPTVDDLMNRKNLPNGATFDSKYILENGKVFSGKENRITNEDLSKELEILSKNDKR